MTPIRAIAALFCLFAAAACGRGRSDAEAPLPNLALGRPVATTGTAGDARVVTDGRLLPEAAPAAPEAAVSFGGVRDAVVVDLGSLQPVGAMLIQADAADVYFVELSVDASAWHVVWRVAPLTGGTGLLTRHTTLPRPLAARFLRARATTARSAAVSELQAFSAEPRAWPRLDDTLPGARRPLWPSLTRERLDALFAGLAALFLAAAAWTWAARRLPAASAERRWGRRLLIVVAAAAVLAWPNFLNFHYYGFVHQWEFFHYFMGAKYLPETGYSCLYSAAAAADAEDGIDMRGRVMRDLRDNRLVPTEVALEHGAQCRARFSAARWEDFRRDARFFREAMGPQQWFGVRNDHGFNGTPAWAVAARLLGGLGAASRPLLVFIALLDVVLILAIFVLIGRSFGIEAACIAAGYWGVNTLAPFGWTGGGFLRYDWLFWLVAGVVSLRRGRNGLAGFALGYAAMLRVFPACAIAGVALQALVEAATARSVRPLARHARLAAGIALAMLLFAGISSLTSGGPAIWREFGANSLKHRATASHNLVGIEAFLAYEHEGRLELMTDPLLMDRHAAWRARVTAASGEMKWARWLAAALFVVILAVATRGAPAWVAAVLGVGLMPMLFVLSSYYYSAFLVFAALVAVRAWNGVALAGLAWTTTLIAGVFPSPDGRYAALSLAVVAYVMGVTAALAWASAKAPAGDDHAFSGPDVGRTPAS